MSNRGFSSSRGAARTVAEFPEALQVNTSGTLFLLEAIAATAPHATVIVASSSAVYARQPAGVQSSEHHMACPTTLYGISKAAQELVALRYYATYGLRVIIARPFNICGPGEGRNTVAGAIAHQMAEIEAGNDPRFFRLVTSKAAEIFATYATSFRPIGSLPSTAAPDSCTMSVPAKSQRFVRFSQPSCP